MKVLSLSRALLATDRIRERFRSKITKEFEVLAKDCATCEVRGSCCTDEHFVNVRVTRLEAEAINRAMEKLTPETRARVLERNYSSTQRLSETRGFYSCPLYEKDSGCLVHNEAKPLPCIHHACYERREDLPPDAMLQEAEADVVRLNALVYGNAWSSEPIPIAISRFVPEKP
ncbi:MAG: hypothetical protein J5I65_17870 [Aridibacter famidurans]|nr:hypothetical protein [Aridibacter famidurans]